MKMLTCSKCGHAVDANARFCPSCHVELAGIKCPKCGSTNRESVYLANRGRCPGCHAKVLHAPDVPKDNSICPACKQKKKNKKSFVCEHCGRTSWGRIIAGFLAGLFLVMLGYLYRQMLPETGGAIAFILLVGGFLIWSGAIKGIVLSYRLKRQLHSK